MGFTTLFDIAGSMIIGGILMMTVWNLSDASTEKTYSNSGELTVQQNLLILAQIVEFDFRKIGYCNSWNAIMDPRTKQPFNSSQAIIYADETSISFYTDLEPYDGVLDSVSYYLGPVSDCSETPNPRDRMLYRVENNETPRSANLGVTDFRMTYYDVNDNIISPPVLTRGLIKSIEINITVENTAAYDEKYSSAFWKQIRLASRNVSRSKTE